MAQTIYDRQTTNARPGQKRSHPAASFTMKRDHNTHEDDYPLHSHDFSKRRKLNFDDSCNSDNIPRLDVTDPVHARRIQQRRRMVAFGKNTVGYDEYIKQVPRHERRPRSMAHPSTPDHEADIPTRRWQGLISAWRKALHKYDPPYLQHMNHNGLVDKTTNTLAVSKDSPCNEELLQSVKAMHMAEVSSQGLSVAFSEALESGPNETIVAHDGKTVSTGCGYKAQDEGEDSVGDVMLIKNHEFDEINQSEPVVDCDFLDVDFDDSDDDLL